MSLLRILVLFPLSLISRRFAPTQDALQEKPQLAQIPPRRANPALYNVSTGTQDTADRQWTRAYLEGTADAMVGLEAEKRASMYDFGSPWIMGDGASPLNLDLQRHMDRDYKLSWYEQYAEDSEHAAGLVFANFYWRLRQTNVASLDRLMALSMKAFKLAVRGANGVYDLDDFLEAVKDASAPSETALRNAIDTVWQQMDDRDPPPGGSAPLAPSFVDGLPYGCSYYGHSVYCVFWSASATALGYDVWATLGGAFYEYLGTTGPGDTDGYLYVTVNANMRVLAWNRYGHSGLSADSFNAPHTLCN